MAGCCMSNGQFYGRILEHTNWKAHYSTPHTLINRKVNSSLTHTLPGFGMFSTIALYHHWSWEKRAQQSWPGWGEGSGRSGGVDNSFLSGEGKRGSNYPCLITSNMQGENQYSIVRQLATSRQKVDMCVVVLHSLGRSVPRITLTLSMLWNQFIGY